MKHYLERYINVVSIVGAYCAAIEETPAMYLSENSIDHEKGTHE